MTRKKLEQSNLVEWILYMYLLPQIVNFSRNYFNRENINTELNYGYIW